MNDIEYPSEIKAITDFIKDSFQKSGFTTAVLGLSGGVDSSVSFALTVQALGKENVYPVLLPFSSLSTSGVLDAMDVITLLGIPLNHVTRIDIKSVVDAIASRDPSVDRVRKGNIMARIRMTYLFDEAKRRRALVVGTENKTEHMLGYFTRFGDEGSDIEPIRHLYKTHVFALAKTLGIPEKIITKPPSADLWPEQTDEKEFGFTYQDADEILYMLYEEKLPKEQIIAKGYSNAVIELVQKRVEQNIFKTELPYFQTKKIPLE